MAQNLQFPPDYKLVQLQDMAGLNTKAQRPAIDDQQSSWLMNYIPIGKGNLRSMWDKGANLYTATGGKVIIQTFFYNISSTTYVAVFLDDGSAVQVQLSNGATTTIGAAGHFWSAGQVTPHCTQWASSGILIVSQKGADSYWAWDGTLYNPGDASPSWLNGGTPTTMPTGIAGSDIEIFLTRVWIVNNTNILTSAASNGADFATAHGGLVKPNTESSLRIGYTGIKQANGYLYVTGDSSTAYITNVQSSTTGGVTTTTYQFTVIDPQIGTPWRDSLIPFGRSILFANTSGIYAVYGSSVNKISEALDGIWNTQKADFTTVVPSSAVATLFGIKVFQIAVKTTNPTTGTSQTMMACFDGQKWFMASQSSAPTQIQPQEVSSNLQCWGTDGTHVFPCFTTAGTGISKVVQSKLWEGEGGGFIVSKKALRFYSEVDQISSGGTTFTCTVDTDNGSLAQTVDASQAVTWVNASNGIVQWQNGSGQNINWTSMATISVNNSNAYGLLLGFTLTSSSTDFVLERAGIGYVPYRPLY